MRGTDRRCFDGFKENRYRRKTRYDIEEDRGRNESRSSTCCVRTSTSTQLEAPQLRRPPNTFGRNSDFHDCAYVERNRTLLSSLNSPGAFSHNARNLRVHARVLAFSLLIAVPHSVPRDASVSRYPLPRTRKQQEVGSSNKLPSVQCDETRLERSLRDLGQRESFVVPRLPSTSLKTLKG